MVLLNYVNRHDIIEAMSRFVHPSIEDITLTGVLAALADPFRLQIVQTMLSKEACMSCTEAAPCPNLAKSTLSHHFRILREAGIIRTSKKGVENRNIVRIEDLNARFPELLETILKFAHENSH